MAFPVNRPEFLCLFTICPVVRGATALPVLARGQTEKREERNEGGGIHWGTNRAKVFVM